MKKNEYHEDDALNNLLSLHNAVEKHIANRRYQLVNQEGEAETTKETKEIQAIRALAEVVRMKHNWKAVCTVEKELDKTHVCEVCSEKLEVRNNKNI